MISADKMLLTQKGKSDYADLELAFCRNEIKQL